MKKDIQKIAMAAIFATLAVITGCDKPNEVKEEGNGVDNATQYEKPMPNQYEKPMPDQYEEESLKDKDNHYKDKQKNSRYKNNGYNSDYHPQKYKGS